MKPSIVALFLLASFGLFSRHQSHAETVFCPTVMEERSFCELVETAHVSAEIRIDTFSNITHSNTWYAESIVGEIQQVFYTSDALSTTPGIGDSVTIYNEYHSSSMAENRSYFMTLFMNQNNLSSYIIPPCRAFSCVKWIDLEKKYKDALVPAHGGYYRTNIFEDALIPGKGGCQMSAFDVEDAVVSDQIGSQMNSTSAFEDVLIPERDAYRLDSSAGFDRLRRHASFICVGALLSLLI